MAFNDTKQFINAVVQHQDARGISKNEILADKVALQSRNKSERLKPRKQSRTGYGGGGELEENGGSGGAGISSPLVETRNPSEDPNAPEGTAVSSREYYDTVTYRGSYDGLIRVKVNHIKTMNFLDADSNPVQIQFNAPEFD